MAACSCWKKLEAAVDSRVMKSRKRVERAERVEADSAKDARAIGGAVEESDRKPKPPLDRELRALET